MKLREIKTLVEVTDADKQYLLSNDWESPQAIQSWLKENGYKKIGQGAYSEAWEKPGASEIVKISVAEDRCWKVFINWSNKLKNNPHVPKKLGVLKEYRGTRDGKPQKFIIAVIEKFDKLTPEYVRKAQGNNFIGLVELYYGSYIRKPDHAVIYNQAIRDAIEDRFDDMGLETNEQVEKWLDERHINPFSKALGTIYNMAERTACTYDFHDDNLMVRPGTGDLVILDPLADKDNLTIDDI